MLEFILVIATLALCAIAYQLVLLRGVLEEQGKVSASVLQQQELDQEIVHACPNLFYQFKPGLREWFAIHRRKSEYYGKHKRFGDFVSPHSDEESSWFDIYTRLEAKGDNTQKAQLATIASATDGFLRDAGNATILTPPEVNFLAFQEWRDLLSEGGDEKILGIMHDHLRKRFESHLENYGRPSGKAAG